MIRQNSFLKCEAKSIFKAANKLVPEVYKKHKPTYKTSDLLIILKVPTSFLIECTRTKTKGKRVNPVLKTKSLGQGRQREFTTFDLCVLATAKTLNQEHGTPLSMMRGLSSYLKEVSH